jgi:hypothetical protein
MSYLPRNIRIDWLRFQFSSYQPSLSQVQQIIGLPFEKKNQQLKDIRDTNFLALNKLWHEIYEFQGSLLGVRYPPTSVDKPFDYFVDLNGSTLSAITIEKVAELLSFCQFQDYFIANRIDVALDFPVQSPRLSERYWEVFLAEGLLYSYRSVRRISNTGNSPKKGTTVYLGSRQSECFVRIYDKNINDTCFDRIEVEFKRTRANFVMTQIANCLSQDLPQFLNGSVCGQIVFKKAHPDTEFFKDYKFGPILIPPPSLNLDIERSIGFVERHAPTFSMIEEFMGSDRFAEFMSSTLESGRYKMKSRHRTMINNARLLGLTTLAIFLVLIQNSGAIASGLTCPAPVSLSSQISQRFPFDIVIPNPSEQQFLDAVGDGCFQINSGLNFDKICLPGMIVNALRPFVIMGLGIKFIFSD